MPGEDDDFFAAQLLDLSAGDKQAFQCYENTNKVVFWPPRPDEVGFNLIDEEDTDGHWGMNWPIKVLSSQGQMYQVEYDNGAIGNVLADHVSPKAWDDAPVPFGGEASTLAICEFAEVFNGSTDDPGSWPAVITNHLVGGGYEVFFPFHPTESREQIPAERIRRYRVWKGGGWRLIHPKCWKAFDRWRGATGIKQPKDLKSIEEHELDEALLSRFGCARCRYAGVGCLSCDFNRPNYRGVFQAKLLPRFQAQKDQRQLQQMERELSPNASLLPGTSSEPPARQPILPIKREPHSPSSHSNGGKSSARPMGGVAAGPHYPDSNVLQQAKRKHAASPQQKAHNAQQKAQRKAAKQAASAGPSAKKAGSAGPSAPSPQAQWRAAMQQAQASQQRSVEEEAAEAQRQAQDLARSEAAQRAQWQAARQWALARAHAQAHAEAQAREAEHAQLLLEQAQQEVEALERMEQLDRAQQGQQGEQGQVQHTQQQVQHVQAEQAQQGQVQGQQAEQAQGNGHVQGEQQQGVSAMEGVEQAQAQNGVEGARQAQNGVREGVERAQQGEGAVEQQAAAEGQVQGGGGEQQAQPQQQPQQQQMHPDVAVNGLTAVNGVANEAGQAQQQQGEPCVGQTLPHSTGTEAVTSVQQPQQQQPHSADGAAVVSVQQPASEKAAVMSAQQQPVASVQQQASGNEGWTAKRQQAMEKQQRLWEEAEAKRLAAEAAAKELEALAAKEQRVSKAQADAAEARSKLAEARKQLVVTQQGIEQELRAQLEKQLQEQLERRMQQPRLHVALLENALAIADVTATQAMRAMSSS